jgi:hypothetical protein
MKTNLFLLLIILLIFSQCGKKDKPENADLSKSENYLTNDGYILKFKYNPGDKFEYNLLSIAEASQSDGNIGQSNKMTLNSKVSGEIVSKDSSEFNLKLTFKSIKVDAEMTDPQGKIQTANYNSESVPDSTKINPAFLQFSALVGNEFSTRVNTSGEVLEVYRLDNIIKKLLGPNAGKVNENQRNQLQASIQTQIKTIIEQIFQYMPNKPIKMDSSWNRYRYDKMGEMNIKYMASYTLSGVTKANNEDIANIKAKLASEMSGNNKFEENGVKYDLQELTAYGNGSIDFNLNKGFVNKKEMDQGRNQTVVLSKEGKTMKIITKEHNIVKIELIK